MVNGVHVGPMPSSRAAQLGLRGEEGQRRWRMDEMTTKGKFRDADIALRVHTSTGVVPYTRTGVAHASWRPGSPAGQSGGRVGWGNEKGNVKGTRGERGEGLDARCLELADRQLMMPQTPDKR